MNRTMLRQMWHRIANECAAESDWLSPHELDFVESMIVWTTSGVPTERQQAWLETIHEKLGER
jgi:hypothetical protein